MNSPVRLVILDRGFVYVGKVALEDGWLVIRDAKNVRRYGTVNGLGQLALEGPQLESKLDPCGTVRAPLHAVVHTLDTEEKLWTK